MKIQVDPEIKNQHSSLYSLLNYFVEREKGKYLVEKVRLDSWILTHFDEEKLKEIKPSRYFEIVIYLEEVEVFKKKTKKLFLESVDEIEGLLTPAATAFKLYDLTRANILLESILEGVNSILAYIDTINHPEKKQVLENALSVFDRMVFCQEKERYEEIGDILKIEIRRLLELCKSLI
ncbi:hypothetical protein TTHT_1797 [Thermotomaculum hydrothermale]|uniref:Uncharacterized protein n=1 Tax=Thermotomaculum hydrothermale TaxID=981385 RepID=A0A7R6PGE7_9BACT|nr:hypothetical protein [Thermotomaculum hydrothermale]BBB33259.1 hypothetical protein TTHT_1797 [Thermotomaculum hydrothermale]